MVTRDDILDVLKTIDDPEMPITIVDLGIVEDIRLDDAGHVGIQVHGGNGWPKGAKVRFRGIQVRSLKTPLHRK